ncbi:SIR2 family protein [Neptuniibacter marinus]|uniref:SIR2 family protein n=1 Tax=Neptuniibacter marinus TaxID=1806670 RepID=UPI003B5A4D27
MTDFDYQKQAQDYYAKAPVIILGSGASMAFGLPGMGELAEHIKTHVDTSAIPCSETGSWSEFCSLLETGTDLEAALHQVNFSNDTTDLIIQSVWDLINSRDESVYQSSIDDRHLFSLGTMLSHMFKSSLSELNIVTTNYDCLAEYACDQEGLHHYSGFSHGYTRRLAAPGYISCSRKVNIWKVHGSLDWFYSTQNETISIPKSQFRPDDYRPQIVTPGVQKYQKTHLEPYRSIIGSADTVLSNASAYLCVGFGFNDEHIQPKLLQKCQRDGAAIVIVTYALTDQAKALIFDGNIKNYLAIERADDGRSRIYSSQLEDPIIVEGDFWSLQGFLNLIM